MKQLRLFAVAFAALLLPASTARAQTCAQSCPSSPGFSLDWKGGVLGTNAQMLLEGPVQNFVMIVSPQGGPTRLDTFFPGDPRCMCVGFNHPFLWRLGMLGGIGTQVSVSYALPPDPQAAGFVFHGQAATFPGPVSFVDLISNPISFGMALPGQNHPTVGPAVEARSEHTATTLQDGRVFIAGGLNNASGGVTPSVTWELFDPLTQTFQGGSAAPYLLAAGPRRKHTATLLANGRVLLIGGVDPAGIALSTAEVFDPQTNSMTQVAPLSAPRVLHTATLLQDGIRVLVVGGATRVGPDALGFPDAYQNGGTPLLSLYNSATNNWTNLTASLGRSLVGHRASRLADGKVVITGGVEFFQQPVTVATVRIFDPALNQLSVGTPLPQRLAFHNQIETLDGKVLVAGGAIVSPSLGEVTPSLNSYSFVLGPGSGSRGGPDGPDAWTTGPVTAEEAIDGEIICVANGPATEYIIVSGYEEVDPNGDFLARANLEQLAIDSGLTAWRNLGQVLAARPEGQCSSIDEDLRYLISGAGFPTLGGIEPRGEIHTRGP